MINDFKMNCKGTLVLSKSLLRLCLIILALNYFNQTSMAQKSFPLNDELIGKVKIVHIEIDTFRTQTHVKGRRLLAREFSLDEKGRKLNETIYKDGVTLIKNVFSYDVKGRVKEIIGFKVDGSVHSKKVYTPDNSGMNIKEIIYRSDGAPEPGETVYKYDSSGKQIGLTAYDVHGAPSVNVIISYDSKDLTVEVVLCAVGMNQNIIVPSSNGKGTASSDNLKNKMYGVSPCTDGLLTSRTLLAYDDAGHLVETATYSYDDSLIGRQTYTYKFDSRGNWVEKTASKWNVTAGEFEVTEVTYRDITYY